MLSYVESSSHTCLVLECASITLHDSVRTAAESGSLDSPRFRAATDGHLRDLLAGLAALHDELGYAHLDVKPENCLLFPTDADASLHADAEADADADDSLCSSSSSGTSSGSGSTSSTGGSSTLKLCDFGMATTELVQCSGNGRAKGTRGYAVSRLMNATNVGTFLENQLYY